MSRSLWLSKIWAKVKPYLTPKMFISFGLAWLITNGWCYIFIALGPILGLKWMTVAGSTWAVILWLPFTIEKPVTFAIALWIQKKLFINKKRNDIIKSKGDDLSE